MDVDCDERTIMIDKCAEAWFTKESVEEPLNQKSMFTSQCSVLSEQLPDNELGLTFKTTPC